MNVALGDLPTSAKIAVQPKVRDRVKNVHSLLIDTVEHVTGPDGIVKPKAVKYWLKVRVNAVSIAHPWLTIVCMVM